MKEVLKSFNKDFLIKMYLKGYSDQEIANEMGILRPNLIKYVKQYNQEKESAELLFNFISDRCEQAFTIFTTNLPFDR